VRILRRNESREKSSRLGIILLCERSVRTEDEQSNSE
jgi:hypothetical protein